tara:strand:- start:182 stop:370 length:189 start_codon:yes stop_codon:yes gene_type:complete
MQAVEWRKVSLEHVCGAYNPVKRMVPTQNLYSLSSRCVDEKMNLSGISFWLYQKLIDFDGRF